MSEYIPIEMQAEILKRLPVKPLLQFRTVSKSYKSLIDSTDFIVSYGVHHHSQQPDDRFILRYFLDEERYITFVDDDDNGFIQQEFIPPVPDLIKTLVRISVVGSSNGLMCFTGYYENTNRDGHYNGREMVVLWNVSIRKSVGIQAPYTYDSPNKNFCHVDYSKSFGFGVCPVTCDPTILTIECYYYKQNRDDMFYINAPWKVRVFTLSTGTWSDLSTNLPRESISLGSDQVVIDRYIYWVAYDMIDVEDGQSQSHYLIMSFDLTAKEFKEISLPDSITNRSCRIQTISKLQESLVLLEYDGELPEEGSVCRLWMMKEQGVSRDFTKMYTINLPDATINQILGFRKTGELIMETQQHNELGYGEIQVYEKNHEYVNNLGIDGAGFFMCSYMETLLLLDKSDGYMITLTHE